MDQSGFSCRPRHFRNQEEFERWYEIRSAGFGEWYVEPRPPKRSLLDNRHVANCKAALFPEFIHELRDDKGAPIGFLATVPGYWSGNEHSLHDYSYIEENLQFHPLKMLALTAWYLLTMHSPRMFDLVARKIRASRMTRANAVFLIAILVAPEHRSLGLPQYLIGRAKDAATRLGYDYVVAPFRPNAYGKFKAAGNAQHTDELFAEYCKGKTPEGLPQDPWLRAVVRLGAHLYRPVANSFSVRGSLAKFERLRKNFRPNDWYSPAPDVWECGETCTWYVDRARRLVMSVESNYWGAIDLREQQRQAPDAVAAMSA
ncbi:MAG: hypothetical protein IPG93_04100 [Burkholderiales bacterium]|nr:hypothetical protein [Burkholderiales bacterium]